MVHELKTWPLYFRLVRSGEKTFEVRRNDRNFKKGDFLHLKEWNNQGFYTGHECFKEVTYILEGGQWGIDKEFVVMALADVKNTIQS